jgi:ABC-type sugar transport system substrate-binding protein
MRRMVVILMAAVTTVSVFAGGGSQSGAQSGGARAKPANPSEIVVCYAIKGQNAWLEELGRGTQDACKEFGIPAPTIVYADSQINAESQVTAIEDFMALGANVIIIDPISPPVVRQALQNARNQGVITIDTDTVGELDDVTHASIGLDEYNASLQGASKFLTSLNKGDGVVIITGTQGDNNGENRLRGMTKAIEDAGMARLGYQYTDWSPPQATAAMEDFITRFGDRIKGVMVSSDDLGLGALAALEQAGMSRVKIMGYGGFQIAFDAIRDGKMEMTIGMHPYMCGYRAVEIAKDILLNNSYPPQRFIDVGTDLIDRTNYTRFKGF